MGGAGSVARPPAPAAWGAGGDVLCVELRAATGFPAAPPAGGGLPFVALRVGASDDAPVAARWPHARRAETAPVWRGWRPLGAPEGCAAISVELFEGGARATLDLVGADGAVAPGDVTVSVGGCALVFAARVAKISAPKWCFAVRHAESGWNRALATGDVVALLGTIDHGLTRAGVAQARGLADEIAAARCSAVAGSLERAFVDASTVLCSPLRRTVQTALVALQGQGATLELRSCLREVRGRGRDNAAAALGDDVAARARAGLGADAPAAAHVAVDAGDAAQPWWSPGAEAAGSVARRVDDALAAVAAEAGSPILVTHSNFLRRLFQLELDGGGDFASRKLANCGVVAFRVDAAAPRGRRVSDATLLFGSALAGDDASARRAAVLADVRDQAG